MDDSTHIPVYKDYLKWEQATPPVNSRETNGVSDRDAIAYLGRCLAVPSLKTLVQRYRKIANEDAALVTFPYHEKLAIKVLLPLHQAKAAFVLGHELSCIAMCGMIAEMLASLRFDVSRYGTCGSMSMTIEAQRQVFGNDFENLPHSRRIDVMLGCGLIDLDTANMFRDVAGTRNNYLHSFSQPHEKLAADAKRLYGLVVKLVIRITGLDAKDGSTWMSQELLEYLKCPSPTSP